MARIIFIQIVLFLLPFIGWAIFLLVTRGLTETRARYFIGGAPYWLTVAGLLLSVAGFIALGATGERSDGVYKPLTFEDGKLVPGGFE